MQVLKTKNNTSCIKYSAGLGEYISMDVHHEVTTSCIFHYKTYMVLRKRKKKNWSIKCHFKEFWLSQNQN